MRFGPQDVPLATGHSKQTGSGTESSMTGSIPRGLGFAPVFGNVTGVRAARAALEKIESRTFEPEGGKAH